MKTRSRIACLSAAVAALLYGTVPSQARDLTWDANGTAAPLGQDGSGTWDLSSQNWVDGDLVTGTNVAWSNTPGDNAVFGNATTAVINTVSPNDVDLASAITVQDITLGTGADGSVYNLSDFNGGSLTLAGNVNKVTGGGALQFLLNNGLALTAGDHTFALNDTPGDTAELSINAVISGAGNIVVDNGTYAQWGTLAFNVDNTYTGTTTINKGRLVITTANGLGATSAGTTIGAQGELSIGGGGTTATGDLNIAEPITITRNTYTGTDFNDYTDAVVAANAGPAKTITFSGPITIDSTDARIAADTNTVVISSPLVAGPTVPAGTALADFDGDFAGFVNLNADNTAYGAAGNAIGIMGGVELNAANDAALGGAGSKLVLNGGFLHITSALVGSNPAITTNFGGHTIDTTAVGTGVDVDQGQTFTVNGLSGGGVGMRGGGTLNFQGTNTFTGNPFFDGVGPGQTDLTATGIVNYMAGSSTTQKGMHVRSATVNIAGAVDVSGAFSSIGADSGGSNGTPDYGTVNITGNGSLTENSGDDFNISDNANTKGTINISDNGALTTGGITWLGKSSGAVGTINQSGGTLTINRSGNFGFVIADGRGGRTPTGFYNLSGGTFTSAGEVYVGEGSGTGGYGTGNWTQTDGTANVNNWFVVGREGAIGNVDISGGTLNHSGGNMSLGDSGNSDGATNTINVHGNAIINDATGEMWVGNAGGKAVMNVADTASVTVNSWLAIGRGGGTGTVNVSGGVMTQQTANHLTIGSGGTGTVNVTGGTLTGLNTYIGETGSGTGTLNISGTGNVNLNGLTILANASTVNGNLNLNGGTLTAGSATDSGGTVASFEAHNGGGSGTATFTFNGGTLVAAGDVPNFIGKSVTSVVSTGGALINTNGHNDTINSVLTHDSTLAGADGGLAKSGDGNLTIAGASTYTGPTSANAGALTFNQSLTTSSSVSASRTGTVALASGAGNNLVIMTPSVSTSDTGKIDLTDNKLIVTTAGQTGTWDNVAQHYTGVTGMVQSARNGGNWDGTTGITSSLASTGGSNLYTLGVAKAGDIKQLSDSATAIFAGQTVHGSDTIAMYTYGGDANLDGKINIDDYGRIDGNVGQSGSVFGWYNGDFNYDGKINIDDYGIIDGNIGLQGTPIPSVGGAQPLAVLAEGGVSAVPEPSAVALLGLGFLAARRRRRDAQ